MDLDLLLELLRYHLVALRSPVWPRPHGASNGPALYLDEADTQAVIAELARLKGELAVARALRGEGNNDAKPAGTRQTILPCRPSASGNSVSARKARKILGNLHEQPNRVM